MSLLDKDMALISSWPQCQPGETGLFPDGTAVSLEKIALYWCLHGAIRTRFDPVSRLAELFADTSPSMPFELERIGLPHPVLIVKKESGERFGLDGRKRIDCARKTRLNCFPALQLAEADVRRIGAITPKFPVDEETTSAENAAFRLAQLAGSVFKTRVESRPWRREPAQTMETAFGAGSQDGTSIGRPYVFARAHPRLTKREGKAGRKSVPDIVEIEMAIGRILVAIRKTFQEMGQDLTIVRILDELQKGRIRTSAESKKSFPLTINLPNLRTLYDLACKDSHNDVCVADKPEALIIDNLSECWTSGPLIGMALLLRDLGVLRLRIQNFDKELNALRRDAERGATVEQEPYDRMMVDRSSQAEFTPMPEHLQIPGLIDPMAVARETGVFATDYYGGWVFARPMLEVAFALKRATHNLETNVNLGSAVSYLQYRARSAIDRTGPFDRIWRLAVRGHEDMADCLDDCALACIREGAAVLRFAGRP